jgi:hypothetical protein
VAERKVDQTGIWLNRLLQRRHKNIAAVALANKNARIVWALLAQNRKFQPAYATAGADASSDWLAEPTSEIDKPFRRLHRQA